MNHPLSIKEGILLINSLLKGSEYANKYNEFLSKRKLGPKRKKLVSKHYWQLFLKHNEELIKTLKGTKFDQARNK